MNGRERFLATIAGAPTDATPVWFMRQAGGRLPRYLTLRERHSVLEIARTPELCAEVSAGAALELGVDGAVLYADIMLLVEAMGVPVELAETGPVIRAPLRDRAAIVALREPDTGSDLGFVLEAIGLVRHALDGAAAVIGIAGGPFTLAGYLLDGGPTRDQLAARVLMLRDPEAWKLLLDRLADATIDYVRAQAAAGADAIQLFDTWAGILTPDEYRRWVAPTTARILAASPVPTIHSVGRSRSILREVGACGATTVHIDSRQSLREARRVLGPGRPVQGNLDPALSVVGGSPLRDGVTRVLADGGRSGHVFGLGEAVPRGVEPGVLRELAAFVHASTAA
jgi:uroporphyrinogen decarboxylase